MRTQCPQLSWETRGRWRHSIPNTRADVPSLCDEGWAGCWGNPVPRSLRVVDMRIGKSGVTTQSGISYDPLPGPLPVHLGEEYTPAQTKEALPRKVAEGTCSTEFTILFYFYKGKKASNLGSVPVPGSCRHAAGISLVPCLGSSQPQGHRCEVSRHGCTARAKGSLVPSALAA